MFYYKHRAFDNEAGEQDEEAKVRQPNRKVDNLS
jgi:hypothetical protein